MSDASFLVRRGLVPGFGGFFTGVGSVFWGLSRMLGDAQLRRLAMVPVLLTAILYLVLTALALWQGPGLVDAIFAALQIGQDQWWQIALGWLAKLVGLLGLGALLVLFFATIAEAVGGPFYDKMAVNILEQHGIRTREPGLVEGTVPDVIRSLLFLFPAGICWLLGLIPVIGVVFWVLGGGIVWLGFASAAINPSLVVTGSGLGARMSFVFRHFYTMLGIGSVVAGALLVPLLGLLAIPSSIVGAAELFARTRGDATSHRL